jgi:hypothetical protein
MNETHVNARRSHLEPPRPWYREAMVWLIIALPAAALAAGFITLMLAYDGADPVLPRSETAASHRPQ